MPDDRTCMGWNVSTLPNMYHRASAASKREELILAHLPLVRHILGRLRAQLPRGVDRENLEAAGILGLVEAANRFDPQRGVRFDTFAYRRIRGAVLDELRRNCPLPQELLERIARLQAAYRRLPPPVSIDTLARETGLTSDEVIECTAALRLTRAVSWDDLAASGLAATASPSERPDRQVELADLKTALAAGIEKLCERERLVVTLYYQEDLRLKEIGLLLDLSESRVSRLLKTALHNLGEMLRVHEGA